MENFCRPLTNEEAFNLILQAQNETDDSKIKIVKINNCNDENLEERRFASLKINFPSEQPQLFYVQNGSVAEGEDNWLDDLEFRLTFVRENYQYDRDDEGSEGIIVKPSRLINSEGEVAKIWWSSNHGYKLGVMSRSLQKVQCKTVIANNTVGQVLLEGRLCHLMIRKETSLPEETEHIFQMAPALFQVWTKFEASNQYENPVNFGSSNTSMDETTKPICDIPSDGSDDYEEFFEFLYPEEERYMRPGAVVRLCVSSRKITLSTESLKVKGDKIVIVSHTVRNMKTCKQYRPGGLFCIKEGQVRVQVLGPVGNSMALVPSGKDDGWAICYSDCILPDQEIFGSTLEACDIGPHLTLAFAGQVDPKLVEKQREREMIHRVATRECILDAVSLAISYKFYHDFFHDDSGVGATLIFGFNMVLLITLFVHTTTERSTDVGRYSFLSCATKALQAGLFLFAIQNLRMAGADFAEIISRCSMLFFLNFILSLKSGYQFFIKL